jgi:hypothetical protein
MASVKLPVVIKMRKTSGAAGFRKVYDRTRLQREYEEVVRANKLADDDLPMIQELIEGPTTCTLHLCDRAPSSANDVRACGPCRGRGDRVASMADPACWQLDEDCRRLDSAVLWVRFRDPGGAGSHSVDSNCRITRQSPWRTTAVATWCGVAQIAAGDGREASDDSNRNRTKMGFGDLVASKSFSSFKDWFIGTRLRKTGG